MATGFSAADGLGHYRRFERNKCSSVRASRVVGTSNRDRIFFIFFPIRSPHPRQPSAELCPPSRKQKLPIHGNYPNDANSTSSDARQATREEMSEARLPHAYRDSCAHLLIPLNKCRKSTWYAPWKCEDERHSYEKCQYVEFKKRVAKMDELRESKEGARSN
ncbi:hypothetical protein LMH87_000086 [Akanthomyces muscarius]|uniref:NADH dehydrogenase [ubiquinone] 1 beta subcomplex subunit 7 n=1 Tax=Akanthomyces muscarius TaxID=2231603 RepID=A0A9W8QEC3_AKAMU|nr:hypothetical protein LMH87_000086 [Akanthomyces muscarius]KAJ4154810.1 hypothetical protein LMH87_000086 [Akanthomyces muscarius]